MFFSQGGRLTVRGFRDMGGPNPGLDAGVKSGDVIDQVPKMRTRLARLGSWGDGVMRTSGALGDGGHAHADA